MDNREKKKLRKKLFVSMPIQGRILAQLVAYWAVYHVVLWHGLFLYRYFQFKADLLTNEFQVPFHEFYSQFVLQHYPVAICAVLLFPIVFWDTLKISHRVAGPLVRFRNEFRRLARGERVQPVELRNGDLLTEFSIAFNEFVESMEKRGWKFPDQEVSELRDSAKSLLSQEETVEDPETQIEQDLREIQETVSGARVHQDIESERDRSSAENQ